MANSKRKCRYCRPAKYGKPEDMVIINNAPFCNMDEAVKYARDKAPKARAKVEKQEKQQSRAQRREFLHNHKPHQLELTRIECNKLVRMPDQGKTCISCGEIAPLEAGHFRSVGSCTELRFELLNIHGQCRPCNQAGSRKMNRGKNPALVAKEYEIRLRDRIGNEAVDWLQGPHPMPNYTCDELRIMRAMYTAEQRYIEQYGKPSRDWRKYP